jgi:hypothetical protein
MSESDSRSSRQETARTFFKTAEEGEALARDGPSRAADIIAQSREAIAQSRATTAESHKMMAESEALLRSHQPLPAMKSYECMFLDAAGKVAGSVELRAADDAAVIVKARVVFATGLIHSYQIWDVERLVHYERSRD